MRKPNLPPHDPNKKTIFLVTDGQGWVIDRITHGIALRLSSKFNFKVFYYTKDSHEDFELQAKRHADLIHYQNWDIRYKKALLEVDCPVVISVRSHRYPKHFETFLKTFKNKFVVHTITKELQEKFENSTLIYDPIFDGFEPSKPFRVGIAYQNNQENKIYKGVPMVKQACEELGCEFAPLPGNKPPTQMREWFESLDLYVCASINEGVSTPVMECLALNVPVITTDVGVPASLNVHKIDRNVTSIKNAISKFYTSAQVLPEFAWDTTISNIDRFYSNLIKQNTKHERTHN